MKASCKFLLPLNIVVCGGNVACSDLQYSASATHSIRNAILLEGACPSKGMPAFEGELTEDDAQAIRACIIREGRAIESG